MTPAAGAPNAAPPKAPAVKPAPAAFNTLSNFCSLITFLTNLVKSASVSLTILLPSAIALACGFLFVVEANVALGTAAPPVLLVQYLFFNSLTRLLEYNAFEYPLCPNPASLHLKKNLSLLP